MRARVNGREPYLLCQSSVCECVGCGGSNKHSVRPTQYEAATNVVEHMHRVGRTARNGKGGAATHLYAAEDGAAELMEGLEAASRAGDTIDPMFSRKRLLRKKLKRYGEIRADPTEAVRKEPFT